MISGSHGTEDGASALTDIERNDISEGWGFYVEDCRMVGVKSGPFRSQGRPPLAYGQPFSEADWRKFPDITEPAVKMRVPPPKCLSNDDLTKKMDVRVAHLTYYYKNKNKLIRDIKKVRIESNKNQLRCSNDKLRLLAQTALI